MPASPEAFKAEKAPYQYHAYTAVSVATALVLHGIRPPWHPKHSLRSRGELMAEVQKIQDDDRDVIVRTTQETKSSNFLSYILWPPFPHMTCMDALMQRLHGCNGAAPVLHGIRPPWMAEVQKMQEQFSVLHPVAAVPAHPCAPRHTYIL